MKSVADIAAGVAEQFGISKTEAEKYTKQAFAEVAKGLTSGEEVNIHGFGKFSVSERAAREGRNPATGDTIQIAASSNVKFKAAKALKDTL